MRRAVLVGHVRELDQQLLVVGRVVSVLAGPARREDARGAVQSVHAEARVIGHGHGKARLLLGGTRLDEGVLAEVRSVLHRVGEVPQLAEGHKAHARHDLGEDGLYLHDLVRVARGNHHGLLRVKRLDVNH